MNFELPKWIEDAEKSCKSATPGPWESDLFYIVAEIPKGRPGGEVIGSMKPTVTRHHNAKRDNDNAALVTQ